MTLEMKLEHARLRSEEEVKSLNDEILWVVVKNESVAEMEVELESVIVKAESAAVLLPAELQAEVAEAKRAVVLAKAKRAAVIAQLELAALEAKAELQAVQERLIKSESGVEVELEMLEADTADG